MTYIIDIDGTLTMETEGHDYANRTANLKAIKGVNTLHKNGNIIILMTSRFTEDETVTKTWLTDYGVLYDKLILGKIQYDVWIDDKSALPSFLECV